MPAGRRASLATPRVRPTATAPYGGGSGHARRGTGRLAYRRAVPSDATAGPREGADATLPYTAVIFTSRLADAEGYAETAAAMQVLAAQQPGYLGIDSARGADGVGITVSYWVDDASARAWKRVAEHLAAQAEGIRRFYAEYHVRVARVEREYEGPRPLEP